MLSEYVLLLSIRESAIVYHYVTKQYIYIDLMVAIETRITDYDFVSVLEMHCEAVHIFGIIIDELHITRCVN